MSQNDDAIAFFDENAEELQKFYHTVDRAPVLAPYLEDIKRVFDDAAQAHLIDIGAGCGTDALYMLDQFENLTVTAVEPSEGLSGHAKAHSRLEWVSDLLPNLTELKKQVKENMAHAILMDAVFQYVDPADHDKAFKNCAACLKTGGRIYMNFPNKKTRDYQFTLEPNAVERAALEAGFALHHHEIVDPYNTRRSQSGQEIKFIYFTFIKEG